MRILPVAATLLALLALTGSSYSDPLPRYKSNGIVPIVHHKLNAEENSTLDAGTHKAQVGDGTFTYTLLTATDVPGKTKEGGPLQHYRFAFDTSDLPHACADKDYWNSVPGGLPSKPGLDGAPDCLSSVSVSAKTTESVGLRFSISYNIAHGRNVLEFDTHSDLDFTTDVTMRGGDTKTSIHSASGEVTNVTIPVKHDSLRIKVHPGLSPEATRALESIKPQYAHAGSTFRAGPGTLGKNAAGETVLNVPVQSDFPTKVCSPTEAYECQILALTTLVSNATPHNTQKTELSVLPAKFTGTLTITGSDFDVAILNISSDTDRQGTRVYLTSKEQLRPAAR